MSDIPMDMVEEVRMLAKGRQRSLYTDYTLDKLGKDKEVLHMMILLGGPGGHILTWRLLRD